MKDQQRDAIILTMAQATMKDFGHDQWKILLERMNTEDGMQWWYRCKNLPKIQPAYIYWIVGGRITARMDFSHFVRDQAMTFPRADVRRVKHFAATNWIVCQGPAVEAPYDIPMQGFQGFRYTEMLF